MATLASISAGILTKLEQEAGSQEWWTSSEVKEYFNDLYVDICREGNFKGSRDVTTLSVANQAEYDLPDNTISVTGVTYNGKPIYPTTITELNAYSQTWRSRGSGTPKWYYFEEGNRYTQVSLFPKPDTTDYEIGLSVILLPTVLSDEEEPIEPFRDGLIIRDGVISLALAKEGEGQNLERSEFYWQLFSGKLSTIIKKPEMPERVHVLRSIEDGGIGSQMIRGLNLGDHYPLYRF